MTARIVRHLDRAELDPTHRYYGPGAQGGDKLAKLRRIAPSARVPGQLWERIAELGQAGVVNLPQYTPRIADAYRRVADRAARRDTFVLPWPDASRYNPLASGNPAAKSGIIRAGVRTR